MKVWTPEEECFVRENYGKMEGVKIAKKLGRTPKSVYRKIDAIRIEDIKSGHLADIEMPAEVLKVLRENKRLRREVADKSDYDAIALHAFQTIYDKLEPISPPKRYYSPKGKGKSKKQACHIGLEFSDLQLGMCVNTRDTTDLGGYNFEIFVQRLERLKKTIITVAEEQRLVRPIKNLIIFGLGDFVEGENIFPAQALFLDMNASDQFIRGAQEIGKFIRDLACYFENVVMYGVWGNHGRLGRKGHNHPRSNLDYLLLRVLQLHTKDIKNVQIFVSEGPLMAVKIFNQVHLLRHGDDTGSWMGIPFYGMERDTLKHSNLIRMPIDHAHVGHHHRRASWEVSVMSIHMNGSFCGPTPFGVNQMKMADRPCQNLFMVHPDHGLNWRIPIWLEKAKQLTENEYGIFTPCTGPEPF